jgi:hypothetical protein
VPANITPPIVADLGSARKEEIKELRSGGGPMVDDIREAIRHVREDVELAGTKRIFVPVVVVYTPGGRDDDDDAD